MELGSAFICLLSVARDRFSLELKVFLHFQEIKNLDKVN